MTTETNRPSHGVYNVEGEGKKAFWTRIGAAWAHDDGDGFTISLTCLPLDGRLVVRKPRKDDKKEQGQ